MTWLAALPDRVIFGTELECRKIEAADGRAFVVFLDANKMGSEKLRQMIDRNDRTMKSKMEDVEKFLRNGPTALLYALHAQKAANKAKARAWELEGIYRARALYNRLVDAGSEQKEVKTPTIYLCFAESAAASRRNSDMSCIEEVCMVARQNGLPCPVCGK